MRKPSKALIREWRAKLAASGFHDIEDEDGNLEDERARHDLGHMQELTDFTPPNTIGIETKADRFRAALFRYAFRSGTDREICAALAEGKTIREVIDIYDVGQGRVYRLINSVLAWLDPGESLFGPEIPQ